ncbi:hypothetical protein PHYSODRAFT_263827 [Phytophthora sojae]|uniref:Uncharacterized protein n=1 Tax=Phytophthora sojae (strain P6497) TaxID=1094619 RepID=G4YQP8_PHYSP|nr:hypothetical protein PHYSODRAFT_263827 [Phytophthora sojae]EGZ30312.1 hypothetical protein PHYSODRAFT_263827 [Phytophthora sojae]|eukprot:XP_009517587.1 hypothetical protein PHYSODRAFT_263827 [Phytophthora sojae]
MGERHNASGFPCIWQQHLRTLDVDVSEEEKQRKNCGIVCKVGDFRLRAGKVLPGRLRLGATVAKVVHQEAYGELSASKWSLGIMFTGSPLKANASRALDAFCEMFVAKVIDS